MRFISLFSAFAAAVSATTNSTEIQTIAQDLKSGDFVGAAIEILSLGDCDLINLAGNFPPYSHSVTKQNLFIFHGY
jgi:hypothetical protein